MQVTLALRLLRDAELQAIGEIFQHYRDGLASKEGGTSPRPEMADIFADLLCAVEDEFRRRKQEHREVAWMLEHGDRPPPWQRTTRSGWTGRGGGPPAE